LQNNIGLGQYNEGYLNIPWFLFNFGPAKFVYNLYVYEVLTCCNNDVTPML